MTPSQFQEIYNEALDILAENLPEYLWYHSLEHTLYVFDRAIYIGKKEGVSNENLLLLKIAALYHDMGFINTQVEHEQESCKIAKANLKKYNLTSAEIQTICGMITATKIPQKPKNHLEAILADADLEYLGTTRFQEASDRLYKELKHFNPALSKSKWNTIQKTFLTNHHYHTDFCKRYKTHRKHKNMEMLN
ncbi:HD domain-containing protein [Hanstruepera marina]|uniref:HD domain-containing protein n=1 Tax=Hanstruepera marina TaxID=2873265 RepID=UPI001CA751A3|nr:HD domain-containing protein [Hanstruepera marina]